MQERRMESKPHGGWKQLHHLLEQHAEVTVSDLFVFLASLHRHDWNERVLRDFDEACGQCVVSFTVEIDTQEDPIS